MNFRVVMFVGIMTLISSFAFGATYGAGYNTVVGVGAEVAPLYDGEIAQSVGAFSETNEGDNAAFSVVFNGLVGSSAAHVLDTALTVEEDSVWFGTFETMGVLDGATKDYFYEKQQAVVARSGATTTITLITVEAATPSASLSTCTVTPKVNDSTDKVYVEVTGVDAKDIRFISRFSGVRIKYPE